MNKVENVYNTIEDFMNYYDSLELGKGIQKNFSRVHFYAGVMQLCITLKNDEDLNLMHALFINYSKTCYYFQICKLYERTKYNMELIEKVEQHIQKIGIAIRELALSEELEVNNKFDWRVFNSRYRRFMYLSYKSLNHKFDKRGKITFKIDDEEAQMVAVKHHTELSIAQLSEGEKCVLAMTGDLARKLAIANPSRENPLEGEGVVLIDEVDLHLHPSWQGRMMPLLFRTFPNIQFIVTTHSPKVLSEIKDEANIFEIYQDGNAINVRKQNPMNGWDINHIMHTDILNEKTQKLIDEIYNCIENENFDQAEELVDQLAKITDEMNVEVVRARTLIHRKR